MSTLQRTARLAFVAGLCPLIPLPFVDGWVAERVRARCFREIAAERGAALSEEELTVLSSDSFSKLGCAFTLVIFPLKKLFKMVVFVLALKECVDWFTELIHKSRMLERAIDLGALPGRADEVRLAMDGAFANIAASPVERVVLRRDRPRLGGEAATRLERLALRLHREGGGARLLEDFERRLAGDSRPSQVARAEAEPGAGLDQLAPTV